MYWFDFKDDIMKFRMKIWFEVILKYVIIALLLNIKMI